MGEIRGIEPNRLIHLANALRKPKDFLNKGFISDPFGEEDWRLGFGDLIFGEAPETIEDAAYGWMPTTGRGQTTTLKPGVADVAALPTFGAGAGVKSTIRALRKPRNTGRGIVPVQATPTEETTDLSRRKFLKGLGAVSVAGAAAAHTLPDLLRKAVADETVVKAAVKAAPKLSRATIFEEMRNLAQREIDQSMVGQAEYFDPSKYLYRREWHEQELANKKALEDPELFENLFSEEEMVKLEDLLAHTPEGEDPRNALKRIMGDPEANYDIKPKIEYPEFGTRGKRWGNADNPLSPEEEKLYDEANDLFWDSMSKDDIDMYHLTGEIPVEKIPEHLRPYIDPDYLDEAGGNITAWDDYTGQSMNPYHRLNYTRNARQPRKYEYRKEIADYYKEAFTDIAKQGNPSDAEFANKLLKRMEEGDMEFVTGQFSHQFQWLFENLPEGVTPKQALDAATVGRADAPLGGKIDPRMGLEDAPQGLFNEIRELFDKNRYSGDIDKWIASGVKPDWFPDKYLKYIHPEHIRDHGNLFGNVSGAPVSNPYNLVDLAREGIL